MSYLIPESELNILNFNRLIKHTNSYSNEELINKIKENYILYKKGKKLYSPSVKMRFLCIYPENGIL